MNNTLLFQLGNTPELSKRELTSILSSVDFTEISPDLLMGEVLHHSPQELMEVLGGTVKILALVKTLPSNDLQAIEETLLEELEKKEGKITFGLAELGRDHLPALSVRNIKQTLTQSGRSVRFVEDSRHGLSAALLSHKKSLIELAVINTKTETLIAKTSAVQNIDEWSVVDRQKPYADRKKGLLPPKVARMMVTMALGEKVFTDFDEKTTLYDPFCGSGTVLMEAILMGMQHVTGSDLDQDSVIGTKQNIAWLLQNYQTKPQAHIFTHDVTRPVELEAHSIDYLVTEPFLGKPTPKPTQAENVFRGLERLYLGAFKQWTRILKPNAKIIIVFPRSEVLFNNKKKIFTLEKLIDKLANIGYTTESKPILYHRPQAVVQREIYTFVFNKQ